MAPVILWNFNILSFHATLHTINCLIFKWTTTIICLVMMIGRSEPEHYMSKLCCLLHFCLIGKIAEMRLLKRTLVFGSKLEPCLLINKQTQSCLWEVITETPQGRFRNGHFQQFDKQGILLNSCSSKLHMTTPITTMTTLWITSSLCYQWITRNKGDCVWFFQGFFALHTTYY